MYDIERFTLPELVEKSSELYRGRPALAMFGGRPLRYEELEPKTRRLAALLVLLGARPGDRVALLAENSPEWGIAYLAISRAGCVAVPILTDFTGEQVANILDHSESRIVFVSRRHSDKLASAGAAGSRLLVGVEDFAALSASGGAALPSAQAVDAAAAELELPEVGAEDLAAIVYTSGTTGRPKGVMLTQRNLVHDAWAVSFIMSIGPSDRLLSILPLAHTYEFSVGFLYPLMQGSSIHYLGRPPSASALLPALRALRPTTMLTVPLIIEKVYFGTVRPALDAMPFQGSRVARSIFEHLAGAKLKRSFGGRLRIFGIGGAPLAPEVEAFLHRTRFPCAMGYGLTETSPLAAGSSPREFRLRSIGPAIHGAELRIADPRPDTGEGEIQTRGPNVMLGYYKDPERSAGAFTEDGWFRTGDLGLLDAEGRVEVRGRLKTMILGASGENIYPEEVEAVLNASPYVAESLVYGDDSGLTALVQLKPEVLDELGAYLREGVAGAEKAAGRFGQAVGAAIRWAASQAGAAGRVAGGAIGSAGEAIASAESYVEKATAPLLERVKKEANERLAAFSRISRVKVQAEPFEKTPTQKIKRFLYPDKR